MLRRRYKHNHKAQVMLEYLIIISVMILVMMAMSTLIKRGTQGMIKVVADQIGAQESSEQRFPVILTNTSGIPRMSADREGFLESSSVQTRSVIDQRKRENLGTTTYESDDTVATESVTVIDLGFTNNI